MELTQSESFLLNKFNKIKGFKLIAERFYKLKIQENIDVDCG